MYLILKIYARKKTEKFKRAGQAFGASVFGGRSQKTRKCSDLVTASASASASASDTRAPVQNPDVSLSGQSSAGRKNPTG